MDFATALQDMRRVAELLSKGATKTDEAITNATVIARDDGLTLRQRNEQTCAIVSVAAEEQHDLNEQVHDLLHTLMEGAAAEAAAEAQD